MIKGNAGKVNMLAMIRDRVDNSVLDLVGAVPPVDGAAGTGAGFAGPGSNYFDSVGVNLYENLGTKLVPVWVQIRNLLLARGVISAADIVSVAAGKFGHAAGYPLVLPPGANKALVLISAVLSYKFSVAAYTAGGNTTINWDAAGAALTGLVSAANFAGAAADKALQFEPLSTAGIPLVPNSGLNAVSSAAFTQPGTAAGVIYYKIAYQIVTLNAVV